MPAVTVNDLNNAQLDVTTIAGVATSSAPTVTDRLGNTKNTLSGMNAAVLASAAAVQGSIGYLPPVAYAAGINLTLAAQTVGYSGQTYAPILSVLPFTTSGAFETAKFRLIQGVAGVDLAASSGASMVGVYNPIAPAYLKTVSDILNGGEVMIDRFLPAAQMSSIRARSSVYDCGPDIAAAIPAFTRGGGIYAKQGKYIFNSGFVVPDNFALRGDGYATEFNLPGDIELIKSSTATLSTIVAGVVLRDFMIKKEVTGITALYDIHLTNPEYCTISRVRVQSAHNDTIYSATNKGGIFLDRPAGSTSNVFMNLLENCWLQNNSVYFNNITDSAIRGGYVWGHTRQFAIRLAGGGANAVEKVEGIICSKFNGGIWLDGAGINQTRIVNNEFDGNPLLDTGTGIYAPDSTIATVVSGNTVWGCDKHGIDTTDPIGWSITGNAFWKNNASDNFYDDVRITGKAFQPNGNVVCGNTHVIDEARVNKGYAIREVNGGNTPNLNIYTGNGILGNTGYASPAILTLGSSLVSNNTGVGTDQVSDSKGKMGRGVNAAVAVNGTLDINVSSSAYAGTLSASATRSDFPPQSRRAIYTCMSSGAGQAFALLGAPHDGTGGGTPFTITSGGVGIIRFTNTSPNALNVFLDFNGTKGQTE